MASRNLHNSIRKCLQKSQEMLPEDMGDASLKKIAQGLWGFMHISCMSQSVPGGPLCDDQCLTHGVMLLKVLERT